MSEAIPIDLTGLCGSSPLGALAAFGLLRVCGEIRNLDGAKLFWKLTHDWHACLLIPSLPENVAEGERRQWLVDELVERHQQRMTKSYWQGQMDPKPQDMATKLRQSAQDATANKRDAADFLCAFGSETTMTEKGNVKTTALCMTSGNQGFLKLVRELGASLQEASAKGCRSFRTTSRLPAVKQHLSSCDFVCAPGFHEMPSRHPNHRWTGEIES